MDKENAQPEDLASENDQIRVRLQKLAELREKTGQPYRNGMCPSILAQELHHQFDEKTAEELEASESSKSFSVAGRIMAIRNFGKAAFVRIRDRSGRIQLFVQKNILGDDAFKEFKRLDIGDIVFGEGTVFKTKTGELSLKVSKIDLVTKSLRPLPEKYHGLTDVEVKYRQRYLDLIMSDETKERFVKRSEVIAEIRSFFSESGFLEVETPMMHPLVGGAAARPFKTHHNALDMELFLRIAPELYLKRLVVGGLDRVFEINRNFRNEGISVQHNPEFTMLECYQAYATYKDLMEMTEKLFQRIGKNVFGRTTFSYQGTEVRLDSPWEKISVEDAILKYSDFDSKDQLRNRAALLSYCEKKGITVNPKDPTGKILMGIFDEEVESQLIQPTFVTHYPLDVSPLSRKNDKDPFLVDRFELFITGREIANGFSELNDPQDQLERFQAQVEAKEAGDQEACDMDEDYVRALEYGMPPAAGEGIGIDRLVMLFTDAPSIRDVIFFPTLRKN